MTDFGWFKLQDVHRVKNKFEWDDKFKMELFERSMWCQKIRSSQGKWDKEKVDDRGYSINDEKATTNNANEWKSTEHKT